METQDELRRLTLTLPESLLIAVDEKLLQLRKAGKRVSFSALVEVSLRETLKANNLTSIIARDGLSARRKLTRKTPSLDGHTDGRVRR